MARTNTVSHRPHYEGFIQDNIAGGRYNNASEMIEDRLLMFEKKTGNGDDV